MGCSLNPETPRTNEDVSSLHPFAISRWEVNVSVQQESLGLRTATGRDLFDVVHGDAVAQLFDPPLGGSTRRDAAHDGPAIQRRQRGVVAGQRVRLGLSSSWLLPARWRARRTVRPTFFVSTASSFRPAVPGRSSAATRFAE